MLAFTTYLVKRCDIGNCGDDNKLPELSPFVYSMLDFNEEDIESFVEEIEGLEEKISAFIENIL